MAMIRQADLDRSPRHALVMNVENIRAQAQAIMDQTRASASAIIAEARAERERILAGAAEAGHAKGHAEGLARGLAEGRERGRAEAQESMAERLATLETSWGRALEEFIGRREAMLRECEARGLDLAILMGERVARRAIEVDRRSVLGAVAGVLEMASRGTRLTLAVNPADESLVRGTLASLLAMDPDGRHVTLVVDADVACGSCVARTEAGGVLDAGIESRIGAIVAEMLPGRDDAGRAATPRGRGLDEASGDDAGDGPGDAP